MPVRWTEELATGIREIDEQHRDLFVNIAALRDSMRLGNARGATTTIRFLQRYVRDHFAAEERCMAAAEYPDTPQHREEHRAFAAELDRRVAQFEARGPTASLVLDLSDWLGAWLREHVSAADARLGQHLRATRTTTRSRGGSA